MDSSRVFCTGIRRDERNLVGLACEGLHLFGEPLSSPVIPLTNAGSSAALCRHVARVARSSMDKVPSPGPPNSMERFRVRLLPGMVGEDMKNHVFRGAP